MSQTPSESLSRRAKRQRRAHLQSDERVSDSPPTLDFDPTSLVPPESSEAFDPSYVFDSMTSASSSHTELPSVPSESGGRQDNVRLEASAIGAVLSSPHVSGCNAVASIKPVCESVLASLQCTSVADDAILPGKVPQENASMPVFGNLHFPQKGFGTTITSIATGHAMDMHSFMPRRNDEEFVTSTSDIPCCCQSAAEEDAFCSVGDYFQTVDTKVSEELPLYEGSPLLVKDYLISIFSFAQSTHMSGEDLSKLLELINLGLPQPNNLPKSSYLFYKVLQFQESELLMFYFCNKCWQRRSSLTDICPDCKDPKKKVNYFITCPLIPQLQKLYNRQNFSDSIKYRFNRKKKCDDNIEDIYDGTVYKEAEQTLLSDWRNTSLTWYTDGISLYECSPYSLWPFMFIVNELPPDERYKPENIILGGMWGCEEKPHPNVFLLPIYQEITKLFEGFQVSFYGSEEEVTVHTCLLCGTSDVPAKACCLNMKGHAGYESCPKCFIRGEKSARTGNVMVFPHQDQLVLRNNDNYWQCVQESVNSNEDSHGVKGPSILYFMTYSDFISSVAIDSMHCIYIGLGKQLLNLWFNTIYSGELFSLTQKIPVVNERLLALQLPHFVQRCPLGIDKLAFWKASLCMNFLLYLALPVMNGLLSDDLFGHLKLLVDGISLLNSSSISVEDIEKADQFLCRFCKDFEVLYGLRHMSSNLHLLRHLPQCVIETGNLWVTSCFRFEDLNGKLANLAHGTTHSSLQICSRFSLLSELQIMISKMSSVTLQSYCEKITTHKRCLNICERISSKTYVIGTFSDTCVHNDCIGELLVSMFQVPIPFQTFSRLYKKKQLFVSSAYSRGTRVSCYCLYKDAFSMYHGKILTFLKTSFTETKYFALISKTVSDIPVMDRYYQVIAANDDPVLVDVSNLVSVSFCLKVKDCTFIIDPLNEFEMM